MIQSAYLRSYLPVDSPPGYKEHVGDDAALLRGNEHFLWSEPIADDAFSVAWHDTTYVCPRYPRLRMLEGVLAFNNAFPDAALIPQGELVTASEELSRLRDQSPAVRSHILTSPWHVPIRWFIGFLHEERELYERPGGLSIRYRTLQAEATERVARAVQTVDGAGFDSTVVSQLHGLESWLRGFPDDALLELDYAGVADLFSEGDLVLDESAADAAASLLALELGNYDEAGSFYGAMARRWGRVQSLAFSN
jgi:hypothetical protein